MNDHLPSSFSIQRSINTSIKLIKRTHLQDLYPKIWLLKRENTVITLQNPVTLILSHRQNKLNSTKTKYTGTSVEDFMVAYRFTINSPGRRWRVLVGRSRLKRGFFGQVDCWTSFSSSSHSLNLFSSRNFSPKLSIFACKLVAIPHIYCSKRKMLESCALKFKRGSPQEALRQSWPGAVAWHQTWTADCELRTEDCNGDQKCWDLSNNISKTSDPSPPTPQKVEFWAKWVEMSAFSWPQHYWGERGDNGMNPKSKKKIVLGVIFSCILLWL